MKRERVKFRQEERESDIQTGRERVTFRQDGRERVTFRREVAKRSQKSRGWRG